MPQQTTGIRLRRFQVTGFRTIERCELDFSSGVVALIGANASGKTNVARALDFYLRVLLRLGETTISSDGKATYPAVAEKDPASMVTALAPTSTMAFTLECEVPHELIRPSSGAKSPHWLRKSGPHSVKTTSTFRIERGVGGEPTLQQGHRVTVDKAPLAPQRLHDCHEMWAPLSMHRIRSDRPVPDYFTVLRGISDQQHVAGRRSFEAIVGKVRSLHIDLPRIEFINQAPMAMEGTVEDLDMSNMSSGTLRAYSLMAGLEEAAAGGALLIHIEEPETHFHPELQSEVVGHLVDRARERGVILSIETHSPHVLAELLRREASVYRVDVVARHDQVEGGNLRQSRVVSLAPDEQAVHFLKSLGVDAGFGVLGGTLIVTDGPTDPAVYREFFAKFPETSKVLHAFVPMGCLQARSLDLSILPELASRVMVIADGHFEKQQGQRLRAKCRRAGVKYIRIKKWGVENFFTKNALREAKKIIRRLVVPRKGDLDPKVPLDKSGVRGYEKTMDGPIVAQFVTREELESQPDFTKLLEALRASDS